MKGTPETDTTHPTTGHAFILDPDHCIVIYERKGESWVAEFHQGRGQVTHASTWFRSDVGGHRYRRAAYRSAVALTPKLLESIERLHRERQTAKAQMRPLLRVVGATVRRCWTWVTTTLRPFVSTDSAGRSIE